MGHDLTLQPCPPLSLCSGADLTVVNTDGRTALEVAYLNEQVDVIQALQ